MGWFQNGLLVAVNSLATPLDHAASRTSPAHQQCTQDDVHITGSLVPRLPGELLAHFSCPGEGNLGTRLRYRPQALPGHATTPVSPLYTVHDMYTHLEDSV